MTGTPAVREILERGQQQGGLEIEELWLSCLGMGFNAPVERLQSFFEGTDTPSLEEYDVIAQCLNERLRELDVDTPVRFGDELDL